MTTDDGNVDIGELGDEIIEIPPEVLEKQKREEREKQKLTVIADSSLVITDAHRVAQFRNRAMVLEQQPYPHWVPLHKDRFERIAYPLLGGVTRSRINDVFAYLSTTAEDLTKHENYILFGAQPGEGQLPLLWDMDTLSIVNNVDKELAIWRSPYCKSIALKPKRLEFIMQLADGSPDVYDDIMQSLAPLVMTKKPDGVIWWVGDGANGKSTLMDAIYKIFPGQLSSITVKRLTDGRDTPSLNGTLANIVKESSEGRIDDTEIYKSVGTHEDFRVHKFHSQDDILIRGNMHHIFSANVIPSFNDKGHSTQRRTFIVPFKARFDADPTFEQRTFTPEFFADLIAEMCRYAVQLRKQGYRYNWSAITRSAKQNYDAEASNAEEYAKELISEGVVAFDSFHPVRSDYENWCADNGYVPLGVGNMRRALQNVGYERASYQTANKQIAKHYRLPDIDATELQAFGLGKPGMFTTPGFRKVERPEVPEFEKPAEPEQPETVPEPPPKNIVGDRW